MRSVENGVRDILNERTDGQTDPDATISDRKTGRNCRSLYLLWAILIVMSCVARV